MASVAAKNCLKAGGTSLAFFDELKGFRDKFKWVKAVVHPLTRAGKSSSKGVSVLDKSNMARTLGCARNLHNIGDSKSKQQKNFRQMAYGCMSIFMSYFDEFFLAYRLSVGFHTSSSMSKMRYSIYL